MTAAAARLAAAVDAAASTASAKRGADAALSRYTRATGLLVGLDELDNALFSTAR